MSELAARGVKLPEYVVSELKPTSDGVRLRLVRVVKLRKGDYREAGLFHEESYSFQEVLYLYKEHKEEKSRAVRVLG